MDGARRHAHRGERLAFLQVLLHAPGRTGAVAPSSAHLARAMVDGLWVEPGETVVELGPGTGAFTGEIRRILPSPSSYLGIEIEPRFARMVRQRYPDLLVVEGSAEDAPRFLAEAGRDKVKAIICGLPFGSFSAAVQDRIIGALEQLIQPGVQFRTFQYVHAYGLPPSFRFRRRMDRLFGRHIRQTMILRNLPPAYVLSWSR